MSVSKHHIWILFNQLNKSRTLNSISSVSKWSTHRWNRAELRNPEARAISTSTTTASIFRNHAREQTNIDVPDYGQPLESWHYDVNTFGKVVVNSPMSIHVQPLDPQKHPSMDKVLLNVLYVGKDKLDIEQLTMLAKHYIVNVNLDDKNEEIDVSIKYKYSNIHPQCQCHIQIPIKYDVAVSCKEDGDASLENLEGDQINVRTQHGHCYFKSIKSGVVDVKTRGGGIISRSLLQGNVNLVSQGDGSISAGRLQGQKVMCETDGGDISVKAVYANQSNFSTQKGNIRLGSCHGNAEVKVEEGNLVVDTMDGDLAGEVTAGDTHVYVAREGDVSIKSNSGNVLLKVPETLKSEVCLTANEVQQDKVALHNKQQSSQDNLIKVKGTLTESDSNTGKIEVATGDGVVKLQYQDWFSSLNLKK